MKCFETIRKNIAAMGLIPSQQPNNCPQWNSRQIICTAIYTADAIIMLAYVIYQADNIETYMESIFSLTSVAGIEVAYISFIFKNDKILNIFELVSEELTIRSNRSPASQAMYEKTNRLAEKLTDMIYVGMMRWGVPCFVLPKAIISYITYFTSDAGSASFELPFIASLPFDWKNPIGYLVAVAWQYASIFTLYSFLANLLPMAISFILFAISLKKDWEHDLRVVRKMAKEKQSYVELSKVLGEFIRSHSNLKQLSS